MEQPPQTDKHISTPLRKSHFSFVNHILNHKHGCNEMTNQLHTRTTTDKNLLYQNVDNTL